jgi:hypothetical protein
MSAAERFALCAGALSAALTLATVAGLAVLSVRGSLARLR